MLELNKDYVGGNIYFIFCKNCVLELIFTTLGEHLHGEADPVSDICLRCNLVRSRSIRSIHLLFRDNINILDAHLIVRLGRINSKYTYK